MSSVCIDNHLILWGIRESSSDGQEDMIPRTKQFFAHCKEQGIQILVPSVVLAELLTAIEVKHHAMTMNLLAQSYPIVPFDTAAAAIYAKLWQERKSSGLIDLLKIENGATRQELKADCMIVATAIQHKVKALYSHDASLRKFANGAIPVIEVPKLNQQFELTYV